MEVICNSCGDKSYTDDSCRINELQEQVAALREERESAERVITELRKFTEHDSIYERDTAWLNLRRELFRHLEKYPAALSDKGEKDGS